MIKREAINILIITLKAVHVGTQLLPISFLWRLQLQLAALRMVPKTVHIAVDLGKNAFSFFSGAPDQHIAVISYRTAIISRGEKTVADIASTQHQISIVDIDKFIVQHCMPGPGP